MKEYVKTVPIFFSTDKNYLPYLAVAVQSIKEHASFDTLYDITILNEGFDREFMAAAQKIQSENVRISFCNVSEKIKQYKNIFVACLKFPKIFIFNIFILNFN